MYRVLFSSFSYQETRPQKGQPKSTVSLKSRGALSISSADLLRSACSALLDNFSESTKSSKVVESFDGGPWVLFGFGV